MESMMADDASPQQTTRLNIDQSLQQAIAHHQIGRLQDAERLYRAILQSQPKHPDVNHNLGVLAVQVKRPAAALAHFKVALESNPNQGQFWLSYINALMQAGQTDVARQVLAQGRQRGLQGDALEALAERLDQPERATPDQPTPLECAIAHREDGRYKEAALVLQSWVASNPQDASAYALLAQVFSLDKRDEYAWVALNAAMSINPSLPIVQRNHARLLLKQQKPEASLRAAQAAYQGDSADLENQLVLAAVLCANNLKEQALPLVENALKIRPHYAEAFAIRAQIELRENDFLGALSDLEKSLSIKPHQAQLWGMVGSLRHQFENLPGAIEALEKALDYEPDNVGHMVNLGEFKRQAGAVEAAIILLEQAVTIAPNNPAAWVNLGTALQEARRIPEARTVYAKALEIAPNLAAVANNMGVLAKDEDNWDDALHYFEHALVYQPTKPIIVLNRASALYALGRYEDSMASIVQLLQVEASAEAKSLFAICVPRLRFRQDNNFIREAMVRALDEPWGRPKDLAGVSAHLIKLNQVIGECITRAVDAWPLKLKEEDLFGANGLATVAADPLLCVLLNSVPIGDIELERFLTMARYTMLVAATRMMASDNEAGAAMSFYGGLACQCFINEYVFPCNDDEIQKASDLRDSLVAALEAKTQIPALWPVAVAAYFPLCSLPHAEQLLEMQWSEAVTAVLIQQVREPAEEQRLRASIPRLADIEDEVSLLVKNQYEENPYPRWIKAAPAGKAIHIDELLCRKFPRGSFKRFGKSVSTDILIAGCGTGQHSIQTAQQFQGARVLAVDLSLSSLGYAKRKTRELGLTSIEYAQADILKLGSLERNFDVIESVGVLHHLADPLAGWRVLLSLLRPGGLMKLGFYSEVARRNIVWIRNLIAEQGYGSTTEEIRQCRQDLLGLENSADFGTTLKSPDFFSTSTCRDLLFHVQEHRMTLTGIEIFLRENNLLFMGFEVEADVLHAYKRRFPDDLAAINLAQWQTFENENPDTFIGMYQFWIQR